MTDYVLAPPPVPSVAVADSQARFAVRRIFCVARNYAEHAREMGGDPQRESPFFFGKPADAVCDDGARIAYPLLTHDFQHEVELVVALARGGVGIPAATALEHVFGYGVGIDLTRRDLQREAKSAGRPWDWAKGFDDSAPCSALRTVEQVGHPDKGRIELSVNGERKQQGDLSDMIWSVADVIAFISAAVELHAGDLIFTGTPAGVGAMVAGDRVEAHIEGVGSLQLDIVAR